MTVDRSLPADDTIIIETHATSTSANCPLCHHASSRRQSTYLRRLADLPWQGRTVRLHLQVRRFRCSNDAFPRLPDRQASTLAAWLKRHPSIEIVARDRAGAHADGIRQGAPQALQVTDRWHLLRNCSDDLQTVFDRHHRQVRRMIEAAAASGLAAPVTEEPKELVTQAVRRSRERLAQRQARYEEVARLHAQGRLVAATAQALGMGLSSVQRWLRAGHAPLWRKPPWPKLLDHYQAYLARRWPEGCRSGTQLWHDLQAQGFPGGRSMVCDWAREQRRGAQGEAPAITPRPSPRVPTSRRAVRLALADGEPAAAAERRLVGLLLLAAPAIERAVLLARRFCAMIKKRDHAAFRPWLDDTRCSEIGGSAQALERDGAAVEAALMLPWSTDPVEGPMTQLKLIKRRMHGRASFDLLRHRLLAAA